MFETSIFDEHPRTQIILIWAPEKYSGDCAAPSAKQKKSDRKFKVERVRARCSMLFYVHVHMQMAQSLIY